MDRSEGSPFPDGKFNLPPLGHRGALSQKDMLWPLILPFKITFWSLISIVKEHGVRPCCRFTALYLWVDFGSGTTSSNRGSNAIYHVMARVEMAGAIFHANDDYQRMTMVYPKP